MKRKTWTKEGITELIKCLHDIGTSLSYADIRKTNYDLVQAASRRFGSWDLAVESCGITNFRKNSSWTSENIIEQVKSDYLSGLPVNRAAIKNRHNIGSKIIKSQFDSWEQLFQKCDIPADKQIKIRKWNKELVLEKIKQLLKKGDPVNCIAIQKDHKNLYEAGVRHFGSWDNVLLECNLNLEDVKQSRFWTKDVVIKRIQTRYKNNLSLYITNIEKEDSSLYFMAKQFFGSWRNAIEQSGIQYKIKQPSMFGEKILSMILEKFLPGEQIFRNYRQIYWLINSKGCYLELDFYIPSKNLGIEFQGPCHFLETWGIDKLKSRQASDKLKVELCQKNNLHLIALKYTELTPENISNHLNKLNIDHCFTNEHLKLCQQYNDMFIKSGDNA